ncbi:hypothetical protein D9M68_838440 [compost metagenome]
MNDGRLRLNLAPVVRSVLIGTRSDEKHEIRALEHGGRMAAERAGTGQRAKHAGGKRMVFVDCTFAHVGGEDR